MKRRNVIRNIATGSLLVSGIGSAAASTRESGSTMYRLEKDGDSFTVVQTLDGGAGIEHHCPEEKPECCVDDCCNCGDLGCGVCYCHQVCDDPGEN